MIIIRSFIACWFVVSVFGVSLDYTVLRREIETARGCEDNLCYGEHPISDEMQLKIAKSSSISVDDFFAARQQRSTVGRFTIFEDSACRMEPVQNSEPTWVYDTNGAKHVLFTLSESTALFKQYVQTQKCSSEAKPCEMVEPYTSRETECRQHYHVVTMLAINSETEQLYYVPARVQMGCDCFIRVDKRRRT